MKVNIPTDPNQDVDWNELHTALLKRRTAILNKLAELDSLIPQIEQIIDRDRPQSPDPPDPTPLSKINVPSTIIAVLDSIAAYPEPVSSPTIVSTIQNQYPHSFSNSRIHYALFHLARINAVHRSGRTGHYLYSSIKPLPDAPDPAPNPQLNNPCPAPAPSL